jgi:hypothetical protein
MEENKGRHIFSAIMVVQISLNGIEKRKRCCRPTRRGSIQDERIMREQYKKRAAIRLVFFDLYSRTISLPLRTKMSLFFKKLWLFIVVSTAGHDDRLSYSLVFS